MVDAPRPEHSQAPTPREHSIERLLPLLENATEGSRELDGAVADCIHGRRKPIEGPDGELPMWQVGGTFFEVAPRYTTSVDAALTLVPEGHDWRLWPDMAAVTPLFRISAHDPAIRHLTTVRGKTPALALCIAALRARSAP